MLTLGTTLTGSGFTIVFNAEDYEIAAQRWINRSVYVIGGCCGIGPEHIYKLKEIIN